MEGPSKGSYRGLENRISEIPGCEFESHLFRNLWKVGRVVMHRFAKPRLSVTPIHTFNPYTFREKHSAMEESGCPRLVWTQENPGSNPGCATIASGCSREVRRLVWDQEIAGSTPAIQTIWGHGEQLANMRDLHSRDSGSNPDGSTKMKDWSEW